MDGGKAWDEMSFRIGIFWNCYQELEMKRIFLAAVAAIVVMAGTALVTAPSAQAAISADIAPVVEKLQKTYGALHGFKSTFTQELTHQESGTTETRTGTLLFLKPLLVRWESAAPYPELLLVGEKEIWNYLPDEELAYKYSLELAKDSRSVIMVVTGQSPLDKDFDVEKMQDPGDGDLVHLLLYPKDPAPQMTEAQLWVDPKTSLIKRALVMDFYGNTNQITFDSLTPNAPLAPSAFTFTPPKGTDVEDHTDGTQPAKTQLLN